MRPVPSATLWKRKVNSTSLHHALLKTIRTRSSNYVLRKSFSAAKDSLLKELKKSSRLVDGKLVLSSSVMWGLHLGHSKFDEVPLFHEVVSLVVSSFAPGVFFTDISGTKKKQLVRTPEPYHNALVSTLTCDHPILTL